MNIKKKTLIAASTCAVAALLTASTSSAQPAGGEVVRQDFENNNTGWFKFAQPENAAQVGISREAEYVHGGTAALQFNYTLAPRQIAALALADTVPLARAKTISFWARGSSESTMTFAIKEKGGATWMALFHLPPDQWQQVVLRPSDFHEGFDPNDPRDPDGKLDLASIEWAGLGNMGQFLLQNPDSPILKLFRITPGPQTLWLDDVSFDPAATVAAQAPTESIVIDDFSTPQLNWVPLFDAEISREEREAGEGAVKLPGLTMEYVQGVGKIGGLARRVNSSAWAGASALSMRLSSDKAATLIVQLEERGGGKYNAPINAAGDGEAKAISLALTAFQPSADSRDANGKLDLDQVHQILILDTAMFNPAAAQTNNTLWLSGLELRK